MKHFTMYIDESGIANLTDQTKYFILSGIIVEDKTDIEVSAYFRHIKRRHSIDENLSLHAYDLFENENHSLYLDNSKKSQAFTISIVELVENAPFKIYVYYVNKDVLRKKLGAPDGYSFKGSKKHKEDKELAYEILARKLMFDFSKILKKEKAIGSIIAESRRGADHVLLKTYLDTQDAQIFVNYPRLASQAKLSKNNIHSICFAGKRSLRGGLELVDIVSYLTFREINNKFPSKRNDRKGLKSMWNKIKLKLHTSSPIEIKKNDISGLIPDRIHEVSNRIKHRLNEYRDLVNPTQR